MLPPMLNAMKQSLNQAELDEDKIDLLNELKLTEKMFDLIIAKKISKSSILQIRGTLQTLSSPMVLPNSPYSLQPKKHTEVLKDDIFDLPADSDIWAPSEEGDKFKNQKHWDKIEIWGQGDEKEQETNGNESGNDRLK